jgi:homoserine kinase
VNPAPITVAVPATSANLGPGFDALGLALDLWDEVRLEPGRPLRIDVIGEGAEQVARDESNLVYRSFQRGLAAFGAPAITAALTCHNRIPHGRGLGSSAAAISAGLLLARAVAAASAQAAVADAQLVALASDLEGHPDNVAACLLGGLTIAWRDGDQSSAVRLDPAPTLRPVILIPPFRSETAAARALLPAEVSHRDAARNAGRAALLVAALQSRPDVLLPATADRLHQAYRAPAMPETLALVDRLRAGGLAAVVSGAGPTVLVLAGTDDAVTAALAAAPAGWRAHPVAVAGPGQLVLDPGAGQR